MPQCRPAIATGGRFHRPSDHRRCRQVHIARQRTRPLPGLRSGVAGSGVWGESAVECQTGQSVVNHLVLVAALCLLFRLCMPLTLMLRFIPSRACVHPAVLPIHFQRNRPHERDPAFSLRTRGNCTVASAGASSGIEHRRDDHRARRLAARLHQLPQRDGRAHRSLLSAGSHPVFRFHFSGRTAVFQDQCHKSGAIVYIEYFHGATVRPESGKRDGVIWGGQLIGRLASTLERQTVIAIATVTATIFFCPPFSLRFRPH